MAGLGIYLMGCALLVAAGVLKALRPADTARAVAGALHRPPSRAWVHTVRALAAGEAALGVAGIVVPSVPVAVAVAVSFAAFAGFVVYARATGGALSTCGCFGSPDTPPTALHAALNALVAAGAVAVATAGPDGSLAGVLGRQYLDGVPLVAASAVAAWLAFLVMAPLARLHALRQMRPYVPGGRP